MIHFKFPGEIGEFLAQLFNFSVPFFFSISGYYYYHDDTSITLSKTKRKINHLIPMAVCAELIYFLYGLVFQIRAYGLSTETLVLYLTSIIHEYEVSKLFIPVPLFAAVCWFNYQLIICYIVVHFLIREKCERFFVYSIPTLLGCGQIVCYLLFKQLGFYPAWNLLRFPLFMGVPYFLLGYEIRGKRDIWIDRVSQWYPGILTGIGIVAILCQRLLWNHIGHYIGQLFIVLDCWLLVLRYENKSSRIINVLDYVGGGVLEVYLSIPFTGFLVYRSCFGETNS